MNQFAQMETMLLSFLGPRQETTKKGFCSKLASEVEALEERDFKMFRNKALKLLSRITSRAEEGHQPQKPIISRRECKCHFHICATDVSVATATSISCKGINLAYSRNSDASKPGRAKWHPEDSSIPEGCHG